MPQRVVVASSIYFILLQMCIQACKFNSELLLRLLFVQSVSGT